MKHPVTIMFHTVGIRKLPWVYPHISESCNVFADKMAAIARLKYSTLTFTEACEQGSEAGKSLCLNFDDGYLDNWVHAFPLLKKYGIKATIFVTPEFADPRDIERPLISADKVEENSHDADGCCAGFLSWAEMRKMEQSGLGIVFQNLDGYPRSLV